MYIKVRCKTGAKNESVREVSPALLEVRVREKPEQNAANKRILALVAQRMRVPLSHVRIVSGHHRPSKMLKVDKAGA